MINGLRQKPAWARFQLKRRPAKTRKTQRERISSQGVDPKKLWQLEAEETRKHEPWNQIKEEKMKAEASTLDVEARVFSQCLVRGHEAKIMHLSLVPCQWRPTISQFEHLDLTFPKCVEISWCRGNVRAFFWFWKSKCKDFAAKPQESKTLPDAKLRFFELISFSISKKLSNYGHLWSFWFHCNIKVKMICHCLGHEMWIRMIGQCPGFWLWSRLCVSALRWVRTDRGRDPSVQRCEQWDLISRWPWKPQWFAQLHHTSRCNSSEFKWI